MIHFLLVALLAAGGRYVSANDIEASSSYAAENGVVRIPVDSYPFALLPGSTSALELIPIRIADADEFMAGAVEGDEWLVLDTLVTSAWPFNAAKSWAWWDADCQRVVLASQEPFRMFTWFEAWVPHEGAGFELVDEWQEDPSEEALAATRALLDSGLVEAATRRLYDIFYPQAYYDDLEMAARFLEASYRESQRMAARGDWDGALTAYMCAGDAYSQCGLDPEWFLDADLFAGGANPFYLWIDNDRMIEILRHIAGVVHNSGSQDVERRALAVASAMDAI